MYWAFIDDKFLHQIRFVDDIVLCAKPLLELDTMPDTAFQAKYIKMNMSWTKLSEDDIDIMTKK